MHCTFFQFVKDSSVEHEESGQEADLGSFILDSKSRSTLEMRDAGAWHNGLLMMSKSLHGQL